MPTDFSSRAAPPPRTWTASVVRFVCPHGPAFTAAGRSPALAALYDALLGAGRRIPHDGVGGTAPVRFPSRGDPGDAGWHIDGSYDVEGRYWVNVHSRSRALLALFLFTDVGEADAPTELPAATFQRPRAPRATGRAGDVFICHPFLVHRATWPHRGTGPRMVAQPAIGHPEPFALRNDADVCVVERAILHGLETARSRP